MLPHERRQRRSRPHLQHHLPFRPQQLPHSIAKPHRFAHVLWEAGRRDLALFLQSQSSRTFGVDIHPAARFGQGIIASRLEQVDFTRPYAIFDESVLVRTGSGISTAAGLVGRRVAAIDGSANMRLARTFDGAVTVPFGGGTDDIFGDMIAALRKGEVDAVVDDDVALVPVADDPDFQIAFTVHTQNPWGIAVAKDRPDIQSGCARRRSAGCAAWGSSRREVLDAVCRAGGEPVVALVVDEAAELRSHWSADPCRTVRGMPDEQA